MIYKSDNGNFVCEFPHFYYIIMFLKYHHTLEHGQWFNTENYANNYVRRVSLKRHEVRTPESSINETL